MYVSTENPITAPLPAGVDPAAAFAAEQALALEVITSLTPEEWSAPSGCPGWSTHDLVAHMAAICRIVTDPASLPDTGGALTEAAQEIYVADRRSWSDAAVLDEYATASGAVVAVLPALVDQTEVVVPGGDLGTYPLPVVLRSLPFDHTTHLRADLVRPRGSVARDLPPANEVVLAATVAWIVAALPQQVTAGIPRYDGAVHLTFAGPGGRTVAVRADGTALTVTEPGDDRPVATATGRSEDVAWWATGRADWRDHVTLSGDEAAAAALLDAVRIF
ncbi:MAG TPA: maleylpyruvate isomerase N-terminal domain-containing protein [Acidimicrobiales bacterium]|nr:maleylpyruvate isomerase N-terminal domain-containing protein [Acidimicrobiales bacterium]